MEESQNLDEGLANNSKDKKKLPNATAALACGIISIPLAGLIGVILGIIAISLAASAIKTYNANPSQYTNGSFNNVNAGRICGIIGIIASLAWLIYWFGRF